MGLTSDDRAVLVSYKLEKARRALEQAKGTLQLKYWEVVEISDMIEHISATE